MCVSCSASTLDEMVRDYDRARQAGADLVELRIDMLLPAELDRIETLAEWLVEHASTLVLTCRPSEQGGQFEGDVRTRFSVLARVAAHGAQFVDVEYTDYTRSDDLRNLALNAIEHAGSPGAHLILSDHHTTGPHPGIDERLAAMTGSTCAMAKMVWLATAPLDNLHALDLQRHAGHRATVFCMGPDALPSRILGRKYGAALTYAALSTIETTAPGQPTAAELLETYNWRAINAETAVYGLIGHPVGHSLSPAVHNAAFAAEGLDAVYVPWRVPPGRAAFIDFAQGIVQRPWLDIRGFSITAPHKQHAFELIAPHASDDIRALGAVNTLRLDGEHVRGDNTDQPAAMAWLAEGLGCSPTDLGALRFAVLGAGGLARTIGTALAGTGAELTIHNRTPEHARTLAESLGCNAAALNPLEAPQADVIVNCTPAGTWPDIYSSPLEAEGIPEGAVVFDAVYCPRRTRLLDLAEERGCAIHDGLTFFLKQAARQFTIWTGRLAPIEIMRRAAERTLDRRTSTAHGVS